MWKSNWQPIASLATHYPIRHRQNVESDPQIWQRQAMTFRLEVIHTE
jgi:hypothetical protein